MSTPKTTLEIIDRANEVAGQLNAMLTHTYGCSREAFHTMGEDHKDNYLWACSRMADELEGLIEAMAKAVKL